MSMLIGDDVFLCLNTLFYIFWGGKVKIVMIVIGVKIG
jgi:hypothetical protein